MKIIPIQSSDDNSKTGEKNTDISVPNSSNDVSNIVKFVKAKFPSFILFLHICVSKYAFICESEITVSPDNITEITYVEDSENKMIFWLYFVIISIICFTWELLYYIVGKFRRKSDNKNKLTKLELSYSLVSSFISLIAFQSTVFYMDDNNVFNCFMDYNETVANAMFFVIYGIIILLSAFENYYCPNILKNK